MMPRLAAEEQLGAYEATALGMGNFSQEDASEKLRAMRERAFGDRPAPRGKRASAGELGAIGIGVRRVPVKQAVNDG